MKKKEIFLKLVKKEIKLKKLGKYLNTEEKLELLKYKCIIDEENNWQDRDLYLKIINDFVKKNINAQEFEDKFGDLRKKNAKLLETKIQEAILEDDIYIP